MPLRQITVEGQALPPAPPPPEDQPVEHTSWPYPLNLMQGGLEKSIPWVADTVNWGVDSLNKNLFNLEDALGLDLSDMGDWLNKGTRSLVGNLQGVLEERIKATQTVTDGTIKHTQGFLEERIIATQTVTKDSIINTQTVLNQSIQGIQVELDASIKDAQASLDKMLDPLEGIVQEIINKVPKAILTFIGQTAGPLIKQLNDALEAV